MVLMAERDLSTGMPPTLTQYRKLYADYDEAHPQVQGIDTEGAFTEIARDPNTQPVGDQGLMVPGLYRVDTADGWLNGEHIKGEVGTEEVYVLHTSPSDGELVIPTATREFGSGLIEAGGAVVVSVPSHDAGALDRVQANLHVMTGGVELEGTHLGTQTYFAGTVRVNDPEAWAEKRQALQDGYTGQPEGLIPYAYSQRDHVLADKGFAVRALPRLDEGSVDPIFEFVNESFEDVADHPCRQAWTIDEFREIALTRDSVVKVIAEKSDKAAALLAFGADLDDYSWVSHGYYANRFPGVVEAGKLVYFPTTAKDKGMVGMFALGSMLPYVTETFAGVGDLEICFDACDKNREGLPRLIEDTVNATGISALSFSEIATEDYVAFKAAA